MSDTTVSLSQKIVANTPKAKKRITAADRAQTFLGLVDRFARQILADDRDELGRMALLAEAIAGKLPEADEVPEGVRENVEAARKKAKGFGRNSPETHEVVTDMYDRLSEMRLDWQLVRLEDLGANWLKVKRIVDGEMADKDFISLYDAGFTAYGTMPESSKENRQAKIDAGFKLMDALRAPFGRCPECQNRGRKHANELVANTRTGKVFPLCAECNREKRMAQSATQPASQSAPAFTPDWVPVNDESGEAPKPKAKRGKHGPKGQRGRELAAGKKRGKKSVKPDGEEKRAKRAPQPKRRSRQNVEGDD